MHESDEHDIFYGGGASGAVNRYDVDELSLTTIGVDVGSSTFHFMFTGIHLQRAPGGQDRFSVAKREVLWRSPVYLTPYQGRRIDAAAVSLAIELGHQAARIPPDHVDSGAVILTGDALRTENARSIAHEIGTITGNFMSVSAGHHLEAMLAAFGSGAVGIARDHQQTLLHIDIGGGTTKFAVIDPRGVRQTAAINGGGRIVAFDSSRHVSRLGAGARPLAHAAGFDISLGEKLSEAEAEALANLLADTIVGIITKDAKSAVEPRLRVTPVLDSHWKPEAISFSGGVSEYLYGRERRSFNDIGSELAAALRARVDDGRISLPLIDPGEGIRATVIGAAQSTMELSGNSTDASTDAILPLHDVLVVHPHFDNRDLVASQIASAIAAEMEVYGVTKSAPVAISMSWDGPVNDERMLELARGIRAGLGSERGAPTVVLIEQHLASELDRALAKNATSSGAIVCFDGVHLSSLDYLDVGKRIEPSGVVPLVIKSLLFEVQDHHHHVEHDLDHHHDDQSHELQRDLRGTHA